MGSPWWIEKEAGILEVRGKQGSISRRKFLGISGAAALLVGAGPIQSLGARTALGQEMPRAVGYGPLVPQGDLALPRGFRYTVISRAGEPMGDGNPTPTYFDGMAAFRGPRGTTVLIRNHENRASTGRPIASEIPVVVPPELRYDDQPQFNAGNTKLVLRGDRSKVDDFAVLGGTSTNCAGGPTPWGSWIACEEVFQNGSEPHGYCFEIDSRAEGPVEAVPIKQAGRFVHEAIAWHDGILYETEDQRIRRDTVTGRVTSAAAFYRYIPEGRIRRSGDLARSSGQLQALAIQGQPNRDTDKGFPVGQPFPVEWVDIDNPDPPADTVRIEAQSKGAALFDREEGAWVGDGKVYFDCTSGGNADSGQIWEYDPDEETLTLIYESPGPESLEGPDNLVVVPKTGDIFLCEDANPPQYVRGVTPEGEIYDFAHSITNETEFCGACFSPDGNTLFLNQQGESAGPEGGVTYAIYGPFGRRRKGEDDD